MSINKDNQIQIRISKEDKIRLKALATAEGKDLSSFILDAILPSSMKEFQTKINSLKNSTQSNSELANSALANSALANSALAKSSLAELNDFLFKLNSKELKNALQNKFEARLDDFYSNYVSAMIELACYRKNIPSPAWTKEIKPLENPYFGSELKSLRMYLLKNSLPQFKARNIFIDSSIGDRV